MSDLRSVVVTNADGQSATLANGLNIVPPGPPTVVVVGRSSRRQIGIPALQGTVTVTLAGRASTRMAGAVAVTTPDPLVFSLAAVAATPTIGAPSVTGGSTPPAPVTVTLAGMSASPTIGAVAVTTPDPLVFSLAAPAITRRIGTVAFSLPPAYVTLAGRGSTARIGTVSFLVRRFRFGRIRERWQPKRPVPRNVQ